MIAILAHQWATHAFTVLVVPNLAVITSRRNAVAPALRAVPIRARFALLRLTDAAIELTAENLALFAFDVTRLILTSTGLCIEILIWLFTFARLASADTVLHVEVLSAHACLLCTSAFAPVKVPGKACPAFLRHTLAGTKTCVPNSSFSVVKYWTVLRNTLTLARSAVPRFRNTFPQDCTLINLWNTLTGAFFLVPEVC